MSRVQSADPARYSAPMTGYRVAINESEPDPFTVDPALAAKHFGGQHAGVHLVITLMTVGLWLPVFIVMLAMSGSFGRKASAGYAIRIERNNVFVGTPGNHVLVPLDQIQSITTKSGIVHVSTAAKQSVALFGLSDPLAAARALLAAREAHLRSRDAGREEHAVEAAGDARRERRSDA